MVKKATPSAADAEADERRRLRSVAFSSGLLQRGEPAAPRSALAPSSAVARLQGRDIVRRGGQRKSRFLFSFPGLLAPAASAASGGRVGELADLGSKNPVLYLEFPQGRMKLFGTHVYPKNKYLTLQMSRSAKGVVCEDVFESLIVFSEAWWIGTKEENPEELKLDFPKEFQNDGAVADCDFKGGAGATGDEAVTTNKPGKETTESLSPKFESDIDVSDDSDLKDENNTQSTSRAPSVRQSARTARKALKYTELSSGDDSSDSGNEIDVLDDMDEKVKSAAVKNESQSEDIKPADSSAQSISAKKEPLVQATLFSMLKKAEEKKRCTRSPKGSPAAKGPAAKKQRASTKEKQPAGKKSGKYSTKSC
ncbi:hypothetical protein E2562_014447 [Oryza meyeriana var. granulata]|uniref:DNA-binding protein RHL1 n=1 Tax=Oryza meyeriana var. granulata TaxID=110450 RepID=A0A6G1CP10_9ORYZ|nr:hypothetical protein E2562_014447 [Oryza meyeriana var. granulata]